MNDTRTSNPSPDQTPGGERLPHGVRLSDIERIAPHSLRPHPLNERVFTGEIEGLAELREDIRRRGILVPLVAGEDGTLLAGHNRLRIALELELPDVPVQRVSAAITAQQEREFLIKDNVLRRQLSAEDKNRLIRELYMDEIVQDRRGGDHGNQYSGGKRSADLLPTVPLPVRIEQETGIASGTARRIVTGIRKELGLVSERKAPAPDLRSHSSKTDSSSGETKPMSVSAGRKKSAQKAGKKLDPLTRVVRHLNSIRRNAGDPATARAALEHLDEVRRELRKLAKE